MNHTKTSKNVFIISTLAILISLFYFYHSLMHITENSDISAFLLEADALVHGNWMLKGWVLPPDTFWPTLLPALGVMLFGISSATIFKVSALMYALIVWVSLLLAKAQKSFKESYLNLILTFGIIGTPVTSITKLFSYPAGHHVNIFYFMVGLLLLDHLSSTNKKYLYLTSILFLMVMSIIGDPFCYVLLAGMMLVIGLRLFTREDRKEYLYLILMCFSALLIVKLTLYIMLKNGGFLTHSAEAVFTSFDNLSVNINHTIQGIFGLFGINFFGRPLVSYDTISSLLRIPLVFLVFYAVIMQTKHWKISNDLISQIMVSCILVNLAACVFSQRMTAIPLQQYLFPIIMFGGVLVGRSLQFPKKIQIQLAMLVSLSFFLTTALFPKIHSEEYTEVRNWLAANHYTNGYAGFWQSHVITVMTNNNIKIRPIAWNGQKYVPFNWLANQTWFIPQPQNPKVNFLITTEPGYAGVNLENAIKNFGQPREIKKFGQLVILTWDKDLTPELGNPPIPPVVP